MKGYKVFGSDWTCQDFQYEVGQTYEMDGNIELCCRGFHFCKNPTDCFNYYSFNPKNKVAEVEALGNVLIENEGNSKCCTNKIHIVKKIPWDEVLKIVNTGNYNTGCGNSGDSNSGYRNSGGRNSGDSNSGDSNSGYSNSGYSNSGDSNSGDRNSGDRNSGDRNSGDSNSGDCNACNNSSGVFNSKEQSIYIFNRKSQLTLNEWRKSEAYSIVCRMTTTVWVWESDMSDEEMEANPKHETLGGYLKVFKYKEAWKIWWDKLDSEEKDTIRAIPNFNKKVFKEITGIDA